MVPGSVPICFLGKRAAKYRWTARRPTMLTFRALPGFLVATLLATACAVNEDGISGRLDSGIDGGNGSFCPAGVVNNASWSPAITSGKCTRLCGPDLLGTTECTRVDLSTCQKTGDCVCPNTPCTSCTACSLPSLSTCYQPTNAPTLPACATSVRKFDACQAPCDRKGCLMADGRTACVCNPSGYYACSTWRNGTWN